MKKIHTKKIIIVAIVAALWVVTYLFYSRPMTVSQLYPMLPLDECTKIRGYYDDGTGPAQVEFNIEKDSEEFQKLCSLFYEQDYRRSLRDILPRGTRTHRVEPGDFQWEVYFYFEDVEFDNGSGASSMALEFHNWYGELDIRFNGDIYSCNIKEQESWAKEILDIIR